MDELIGGPSGAPNDIRFFLHRRIGRAVKGFVRSGFNPLAAAAGFISTPEAPPVRRPPPRTVFARPTQTSAAQKQLGRSVKLGMAVAPSFAPARAPRVALAAPTGGPCIFPMRPDPVTGKCRLFIGDRPGRDVEPLELGPGTPVGEAVMGRFGAALVAGSRIIDRAVCLRGMVLAVDGLCYNRSQIKNSERMWPRGRRPLLTGGDMRAISIASRAASRLTRTAERLQDIGLIKKPIVRKRRKKTG